MDLVIIMLGTNDLTPVFNRTPLRIALGAAHLIELVNTLNGGVGTSTDGVDGLHLTAESQRKLGTAVAAKVKEILK